MARLPNAERAIIDIRKIQDYSLNPEHPRGRHKAHVFRTALGLGRNDAEWLRESLLRLVPQSEAIALLNDELESRWRVDMLLTRQGKSVVVRTVWIIRASERIPRLVTCWVL